jgi:hypothetical protein
MSGLKEQKITGAQFSFPRLSGVGRDGLSPVHTSTVICLSCQVQPILTNQMWRFAGNPSPPPAVALGDGLQGSSPLIFRLLAL